VAQNWPSSTTALAVRYQSGRYGKPLGQARYYISSLRTTAKAIAAARALTLVS